MMRWFPKMKSPFAKFEVEVALKDRMSMSTPVIYVKNPQCSRFGGKNAIITAGTLGIGLAAAHRLCSEGANVFICSRKQANVDEAVAELRNAHGANRAGGVAINVGKAGDLEKFVSAAVSYFKGATIDLVVSNVGMNPTPDQILDFSPELYDKIMDTNVKSHWRLLKIAKPHLTTPGATIVLVASTAAFTPSTPLGIYGVSKTALVALGRALATELGPQGIRINSLCPGVVRTKLAEMLWKNESAAAQFTSNSFLKRMADPVDMAGTIAYLLSEDSKHMTGEAIVVAGGTQGGRL